MGTILSSKIKEDGKMIFEVLLSYDEALQLQGNITDVHLFTENVVDAETMITQRGKNEATTYFLVPKELRKKQKLKGKATCQKIETKTKSIFIYVIDKLGLR